MADREFKVIITGDATSLQEATKEGAQGFSDYLNPAMVNFQKDWRSANGEVEESVKKGELTRMVRELKRDFPELGMLARAMVNPLVGGFGILLATLKGVDSIFKDIMTRLNTGIFSGTFTRDLAAATKAAMESEVAWRLFKETMEGVANAQGSVKAKTDAAVAAIRAQHVAVTEQQSAEKAAQLARINMLEQEGKLSGPEAINKRLEVEDKYSRMKRAADVTAKDAEIDAHRKEAEKMARDSGFEEQNAERFKKQAEDAQRDLERFQALKTGMTKALAETNKQIHALEGSKFITPGQTGQLHSARNLRDSLEGQLGRMGDEADYASAAASAKRRYENSMKRAQELGAGAAEIGGRVPGEQAAANQSYRDAGDVAAQERLKRLYGATGDAARKARDLQDEVDKNVEAGQGVMVTTISRLQENTAAYQDLAKRVASLEGSRRMYPPMR